MKKINLGILFGGKSSEHEISLRSAASMLNSVNMDKYNIHLIGISRDGKWYLQKEITSPRGFLPQAQTEILLKKETEGSSLVYINDKKDLMSLDVVFPMMHGSYGEDGTIQGFLKALDIPFVGVDLMASAVGMDKDISKRIWRDAGIPIARYHCIRRADRLQVDSQLICKDLGLPVFVKPANAGSSVGVKKVIFEKDLHSALDHALMYDHKVLIEEAIVGIEIECAILGNEFPRASVLGEIIPQSEFYSYEAKYLDDHGAIMHIPAEVEPETSLQIQAAAILAFKSIGAEGLSRVDFFLKPDGSFVINEINTMPGFTEISMYPKLWEHTGIAYSDLIDQLIELALERHQRDKRLKTTFE